MIQTSATQESGGFVLGALLKSTVVAIAIQVLGGVMAYLAQIVLARWMGTEEYGIYEYVVSWSLVLAIPAGLGLPRAVLRFISEYQVKEDWGRMRGVLSGSWRLTLGTSGVLCVLGMGAIAGLNRYHPFAYGAPLLIGIWMVPLQALAQLQLEAARAVQDIPLAYAPSKIIWPFLLLVGGFVLVKTHHGLTSVPLTTTSTGALLVAVLLQMALLWALVRKTTQAADPVYNYREWLVVAFPLLFQSAFFLVVQQTDLLMVGSLIGPHAAGVYSAAAKTAILANFVINSINMGAAPLFAALYAQGDRQGLQEVVSRVALWAFWPSVGVALALGLLTQPILGLFGADFTVANWELKILTLGWFFSPLCGSVAYLMVMTGHQNKSIVAVGASAVLNLVGNAIAIPLWGTVGAAIVTAITLAVWNIWLSLLVIKHIKVYPFAFSRLFFLKQMTSQSTDSDSQKS